MTVDERKAEIERLRKELRTAAEDRKPHLAFWIKEHAKCVLAWMEREKSIEAAYMRRQRKSPAEIKGYVERMDAEMGALKAQHGIGKRFATGLSRNQRR